MMTRMVSLSVGTESADDWAETFQDLSELGKNLGVTHSYVSVSSTEIDDSEEPEGEDLYYDDATLDKVRRAIGSALVRGTRRPDPVLVTNIIGELQNAGILFRERRS